MATFKFLDFKYHPHFLVITFVSKSNWMIEINKNTRIEGNHGRPIILDIYFTPSSEVRPAVIFTHGFKGFKDWGTFHLVAKAFAKAGFVFIKFNLSHNGSTPEQPEELTDFEAFGNNNFSIELDDLGFVIDYVCGSAISDIVQVNNKEIYLVGHSRGGGLTILKSNEDNRVKKIATWASVNEFGKYWNEKIMKEWKDSGVQFVVNSRTGQSMPLYYQLYDDYYANLQRLHIPTAAKQLHIPFLIIHGTEDEVVAYSTATEMHNWNPMSKLITIEGAGHTFGGRHPWIEPGLPLPLSKVVDETIQFFRN